MKKMMMMAFLALNFCAFSQNISSDFDVKLGEPYKVVDARTKLYIKTDDGTVISVKSTEEMVTIQKYNPDSHKEVSRNDYEDLPKYHKAQRLIQTSEGMFYLYEAYNKKEKTFSVYTREINVADASFKDNKKVFTTSKPAVIQLVNEHGNSPITLKGSWAKSKKGVKFDVIQSFDKSKVFVQYRLKPEFKSDSKSYDIIGFQILDAQMNLVSGNEIKMPYTEKEMNNLAYAVDKEGNAYMLIYLREAKEFELLVVDNKGGINVVKLNIEGAKMFEKFEIREDHHGNVRCAGLYAAGYDLKVSWKGHGVFSFNADGIYTFEIEPDGTVSHVVDIEFPHEVISQYLNDKQREKLAKREAEGKAGVEDLKLIEYVIQEDGSSIVVCEQQYIRSESATSDALTYYYTNMIITKIDADGELVWIKKLPKDQRGVLNGFDPFFKGQLSVKYMHGQSDHVILFVDNPKNENLSLSERPEKHKNNAGGYLTAFKISDEDGTVSRHTLVDIEDIDGKRAYQFNVTRINEVEDGHYIMEAYLKGKKDGMVSIKLK